MNMKQTEESSRGVGSKKKKNINIWNLTNASSSDEESSLNSLSLVVFIVESVSEKNGMRSLKDSRFNCG